MKIAGFPLSILLLDPPPPPPPIIDIILLSSYTNLRTIDVRISGEKSIFAIRPEKLIEGLIKKIFAQTKPPRVNSKVEHEQWGFILNLLKDVITEMLAVLLHS